MFTAIQRIRVEWANCDAAGIIFNPHYYIWMDGGTHSMLQAAGFDLILYFPSCQPEQSQKTGTEQPNSRRNWNGR